MENRRAEDLRIALDCSDRAAELALNYFRAGVQTIVKADGSPVTEADPAVEQLLHRTIEAASPGDAFIGEELGRIGDSARVWILDPIDGTSHFARHDPHWRVHVALCVDGEIGVAVVTAPALGCSGGHNAARALMSHPGHEAMYRRDWRCRPPHA